MTDMLRPATHSHRTLVYDGPRALQSASRAYRLEEKGEVETDREQLNFRNGAVIRDSLDRRYSRDAGCEYYLPYLQIISPTGEKRHAVGNILEPIPGNAAPEISYTAFDTAAGVDRGDWIQALLPDGSCEFFQDGEWQQRYLLISPDGALTSSGFSACEAPEGFETPRLVDGKILYNHYGEKATLEPAVPLEWLMA
ncbi:MAG: hypothetical protein WC314_19015 [Vulcanimicrobiota bacterium]